MFSASVTSDISGSSSSRVANVPSSVDGGYDLPAKARSRMCSKNVAASVCPSKV